MSFSTTRISQLQQERAEREAAFQRTKAQLERSIREKTRPMALIRDHPGVLAGAAMSLLSFLGVRTATHRNGTNGRRTGGGLAGAALRFFSLGGGLAAKTVQPFASMAVRYAVDSLFRKLRRRR